MHAAEGQSEVSNKPHIHTCTSNINHFAGQRCSPSHGCAYLSNCSGLSGTDIQTQASNGLHCMTMSYLGITEALFMWKTVQYFPSIDTSICTVIWMGSSPFPLIDRWTYTTRCTPGYSAVEANYFWAGYFLEFIYCLRAAAHPLSIAHSLSHSLTPA